jgi:hypothetical protein
MMRPPVEAALLGVILQATCPRCSNGGNREPVGDLGRAAEYFQESLAYQTAIRAGVAPYGRQFDPAIAGTAIRALHIRLLHASNTAWNPNPFFLQPI